MNSLIQVGHFRRVLGLALGLCLAATVAHGAEASRAVLYLVGDSTMASYPATRPVHGWGQELPQFLRSGLTVRNHAASGRSSKSYIAEGRWDKVMAELKAGDFVIVQFGHNDSKREDAARFTEPRGSYRENLLRFIREVRAKSATPILATSVIRRRWDSAGKLVDSLGEYPIVTRELAMNESVILLDLHALTMKLEQEAGPEGSKKLHLHLAAGEHPALPEGLADDTHYSEYGARRVAELAAREIDRVTAIPRDRPKSGVH